MNLVAIIDQYLHEDVMIAFSGGVDLSLIHISEPTRRS